MLEEPELWSKVLLRWWRRKHTQEVEPGRDSGTIEANSWFGYSLHSSSLPLNSLWVNMRLQVPFMATDTKERRIVYVMYMKVS